MKPAPIVLIRETQCRFSSHRLATTHSRAGVRAHATRLLRAGCWTLLASALSAACTLDSNDALYGRGVAIQTPPTASGGSSSTSMGGTGNVFASGGSGNGFSSGGAPTDSGLLVGSGGTLFGSGGAFGGPGGTTTGPLPDGGNASGGNASGGTPGQPSLACDLSGSWASYIVQPVTWPATPLVLNAGQGNLQQWNLSIEKQVSPTSVEVSTTPCGIYLPDLQSSLFGGFAKFGIRFPDSLFDAGGIAKVPFTLTTEFGADGGLVLKTDPFALIAGAKLDHPTSEPWPGAAGLMLVDQDLDGRPGVTVIPATGSGYSDPPTDLLNDQADFIYIAERTVQALTFTVNTCDEIDGIVNIATINGSAAIDSSVVGCHVVGGGDCTTDQAQFIDQNRPKFLPSSAGTMISVRIPDASKCADVRSRFPLMQ